MAGNITGEVFEEQVRKQIDIRQKALGQRVKDDATLIYQNNQTAFLRLASSVNVGDVSTQTIELNREDKDFIEKNAAANKTVINSVGSFDKNRIRFKFSDKDNNGTLETTITEYDDNGLNDGQNQLKQRGLDQNMLGTELAKACVLFGGVVGLEDELNPRQKFGIVDNATDSTNFIKTIAAYGWGGISSRGFVPMPSIDNAKVSFYNRGAIQKADVKIKVYSLEQLQIFDLLYFRIGYSMLLEWGHNVWLDNKDQKLKNRNEFITKPFEKFFTEGTTPQEIFRVIKEQRKDDSYNYDAMLGKVTNFTWKFNDDGTYDINLKLIGMGDIIESLKVNKAPIITGKTELTPSQKNANIDKNLNARDKAITDREAKAKEKAQENKDKLQKRVDNINEQIKKAAESYKASAKKIPVRDSELVGVFKSVDSGQGDSSGIMFRFGQQEVNGIFFMASADSDSDNEATLNDINDKKQQITNFISDFKAEEGSSDGPYLVRQIKSKFVNNMRAQLNKIFNLVDSITSAEIKLISDEDKKIEDLESQSEKQKQVLNAERQKLEKRKEQLQLSPETSLETKNKSLFNQQLFQWRTEAQKNTSPGNLFKLGFSANSASPDSTGTKTIKLDFYYVRLGYLLDWVQKNLLLYDTTKKNQLNPIQQAQFDKLKDKKGILSEDEKIGLKYLESLKEEPNPIFKINTDPDSNFCLRFPGQFSSDPKVCIIPSKFTSKIAKWDILKDLNKVSSFYVPENNQAGKVMNIFVNIDHTASVLDKNIDANGKVNLNKFLTALLNEINDCLGNVNKLEPVFNTEENELNIIDANNVPNADRIFKDKSTERAEMAVFNTYGIGTKSNPIGSFLTNVDFQVQLPPNMAAMATISAQANGNIVGENATGLSKLNTGLTDRLITVKLDADSIEGSKGGKNDPNEVFKGIIKKVSISVNDLYTKKKYSNDTVSSMRSNNRDIALYLTGNKEYLKKAPSPFFIPFNLKLDMQGLSGMKNYERFSITENILPHSYRSGDQGGVINFLIKGVSHKIDNNKWTTDIESLSVSAMPVS